MEAHPGPGADCHPARRGRHPTHPWCVVPEARAAAPAGAFVGPGRGAGAPRIRVRAAATRLKRLVPLPARAYLRRREHELRCRRALRRGLRNLAKRPRGSDEIWQDLIDGWDNKRWSASPEYLDAVAAAAL